jgi:hypothetical protein
MSQIAEPAGALRHRPRRNQWSLGALALKLALVAGVLALAACPIAYILWPRWPDPVSLDAPALPITVGGLALNVPPAAIRIAMQRRTGAQERLDLVFLWPSLQPPDPGAKPPPTETFSLSDRIYVTIADTDGTPAPPDRLRTIYPRYTDAAPAVLSNGLSLQTFRRDTPYQNEDLFYDTAAPERFLMRCTRKSGPSPGICMHEQRIGSTDVTVRFPRKWLDDWRTVATNIDRLIASLRAPTAK